MSETFAEQVLRFHDRLSREDIEFPQGFRMVNPYGGENQEKVKEVTTAFYKKYYGDTGTRRLILGCPPARRGTAVTGVPFEDAGHLEQVTGISMEKFYVSSASSDFLYDVMAEYGGCEKFYGDFYMSFVCPLGIVRVNEAGREVNCNYYEKKTLLETLRPFLLDSLRSQLEFGIDTSVCLCIGSGENVRFLRELNRAYRFFGEIVPLEHPRYIMQYHRTHRDAFLEKYRGALRGGRGE